MKNYLIAVVLFSSMAGSATDSKVIDTDLCKVVAHPKQFDKKLLRVRARLFQGMHGAALIDEHCGKGVSLWYLKEAEDHPDFKALDDVFRHSNLNTSDKKIVATFTGTFFRKKKDGITHKTSMVIEASKIEDLDVKYDNSPNGR